MQHTDQNTGLWRGLFSVSPIIVFLCVYLLTSLLIGDFYKMPLSIAFLISSVWGAFTLNGKTIPERIEIFSKGAASSNVLYMVWIFILAGAFAAIAKYSGAVEATVALTLNLLPPQLIVPGLFVAACFISMAIGTSVGTIVALTPLAVDIANSTGSGIPFFVAIILGGAFFGDNLSFISDTTIAATRTQGCNMKDKFFANSRIVFPAAAIALVFYILHAPEFSKTVFESSLPIWLIIPYLLVIVLAIIGINVSVVLLSGILAATVAALFRGLNLLDVMDVAGQGIDSVSNLIVITLLAAGMLGYIKASGGIDFLLNILSRNVHTSRGAQMTISLLVGIVNLVTANNTVAIVTTGSIAKKIATKYDVPFRKSASLLDTSSCIVQAMIPYGAQSLMAASLASLSPVATWPYLFYPQILFVCLIISICIAPRRKKKKLKKSHPSG